jgi:hypothetical protein
VLGRVGHCVGGELRHSHGQRCHFVRWASMVAELPKVDVVVFLIQLALFFGCTMARISCGVLLSGGALILIFLAFSCG